MDLESKGDNVARSKQQRVNVADLIIKQRQLQRQLELMQVRQRMSGKTKLPAFWEKDSATWFELAEDVLEASHVIESRAKYHLSTGTHPIALAREGQGRAARRGNSAEPFQDSKGQASGVVNSQCAGAGPEDH